MHNIESYKAVAEAIFSNAAVTWHVGIHVYMYISIYERQFNLCKWGNKETSVTIKLKS